MNAQLPLATTSADYPITVRLTDPNTGDLIDLTDAAITVTVRRHGSRSPVFTLSTDDETVEVLGLGVFSFDPGLNRLKSLPPGLYDLGCTISRDGATRQLIIGLLPLRDGIVP